MELATHLAGRCIAIHLPSRPFEAEGHHRAMPHHGNLSQVAACEISCNETDKVVFCNVLCGQLGGHPDGFKDTQNGSSAEVSCQISFNPGQIEQYTSTLILSTFFQVENLFFVVACNSVAACNTQAEIDAFVGQLQPRKCPDEDLRVSAVIHCLNVVKLVETARLLAQWDPRFNFQAHKTRAHRINGAHGYTRKKYYTEKKVCRHAYRNWQLAPASSFIKSCCFKIKKFKVTAKTKPICKLCEAASKVSPSSSDRNSPGAGTTMTSGIGPSVPQCT